MLKANLKLVCVENVEILSKIIFSSAKISNAHLQHAYNICAKFQIDCLKTLEGVDYTIFSFLKARWTDRRTDRRTDRGQNMITGA